MATVKVPQSAAHAAKGSALYTLIREYNTLAAAFNTLTAKLDADAGVTDVNYAATCGTQDTLSFNETGAPS